MSDLRLWRKSQDLTQEQLADQIEEPRATYAAYERGDHEMPEDVQGKLREKGFKGGFPPPRKSIVPTDLQALGKDLARKIDYAHEDLKRDIQAHGAALAAILAKLEEMTGNPKA